MSQQIAATFVNGVFRPEQPVQINEGQRVSLTVDTALPPADDLSDVRDLLDVEFTEACRKNAGKAPKLEAVRRSLSVYCGSISDLIVEERDER